MNENTSPNEPALVHGGQLGEMAKRYHIARQNWLDLSTGIAPISYPVGLIPQACWQRLPQPSNALLSAARHYYRSTHLLATPGSQSIIQILPQLCKQRGFKAARVWLPIVGYQEHRKAWQNADFITLDYMDSPNVNLIGQGDIVLIINPNNPSGKLHTSAQLTNLLQMISVKNGLLIIDEAFMDATPEHSMAPLLSANTTHKQINQDALLILRSVGKFFGLAGIRLGFVIASDDWLTLIMHALGPWSVNGPAQYVGAQALADKHWQHAQREVLNNLSEALHNVLTTIFNVPVQGTTLFKTLLTAHAPALFDALCKQGIYVRLCDEGNALRFGIPDEQGIERLRKALGTKNIRDAMK
ncbi:MAG: threonine-phosphate decarboxylase CobD [Paraglaciecola polaris]|uniref:threonine-phosphate decarboxylase CobD n=1 Tax=Paraglaciecola polaris TaxID=222814 RepID=UPI003003568E